MTIINYLIDIHLVAKDAASQIAIVNSVQTQLATAKANGSVLSGNITSNQQEVTTNTSSSVAV